MTLEPGALLGPYAIVAPIGAGGMGEVYRARDPRLGRNVAIKVLPDNVAGDSVRLRRFEQEARAASALNHPNILTVFDFGSSDGTAYLVTELLEGISLRDRLAGGPVPLAEILDVATQIAKGLAASHAAGIVHRDLKPENLFVTRDGVAKILDFGLARVSDNDGAVPTDAPTRVKTTEGTVLGTIGYMAPEQVRGEPADARTDLFAFGCVLYEMLTGRMAFRKDSRMQTLAAILEEDPADPATFDCQVPSALLQILRHCLEKDPGRRFQSARDLHFALESARSTPTTRLEPAPGRSSIRATRTLVAVAGLAVIAVATTLLWNHFRSPVTTPSSIPLPPAKSSTMPSATIKSIAVLPFVNMSGNPDNEYLGDGIAEEVINALARHDLKVVARTSAFSFKGKNIDIREIARRLGVATVVEGSVRQAGDQLRVTAQLVKAADGLHLWSQTFDRPAKDIFAVEDEISRAVLKEIAPQQATTTPTAIAATTNREAYDAYLRARHDMLNWRCDGLGRAETGLRKAVGLDPGFGDAWASLADTSIMRHEMCGKRDEDTAFGLATDAAQRALSARSPSAEGHAALAHLLMHEGRLHASEAEARKALAASPASAVAHEWLAYALLWSGQLTESVDEFRRAIDLDPIEGAYRESLGFALITLGRYEEAIEAVQQADDLGDPYAFLARTLVLVKAGRPGDALAALDRVETADIPDMPLLVDVMRAYALGAMGRDSEARKLLARVAHSTPPQLGYVTADMALVYSELGDRDRAIECFQKAGRYSHGVLGGWRFFSEVRALLPDPRMQEIIRDAGLQGYPVTGPGSPEAK